MDLNIQEAEFYDHNDILGHTDGRVLQQSQFIKVNKVKDGDGEKCRMNDWVSLNWKGYNPDGKLLFDSSKVGNGRPLLFRLGHYEVSKCWDIAV